MHYSLTSAVFSGAISAMKIGKLGVIVSLGIVASTVSQPNSTWGATIRDDQPDISYLNLAASPEYASVGTFVNSWGYTGSAVLIAPDWVLTAAHNLIAASSGTFTIDGTSYTSTQLIRNPNYQTSNPMAGSDFGLVHLSSSVEAIPPATLYTGSSELGQVGTFVGFGFTGTGLTGYKTLDGQERAFQNMIDGDFGDPSLVLGCDFDSPHTTADNVFGDTTPLTLEGCAAPGDSGGGVFITVDSQTYLAGTISFIAATNGTPNAAYGNLTGFGRVSAFVPWIDSVMIPEPSIFALLCTACASLFCRWRFRQGNVFDKGHSTESSGASRTK